MKEYIFTLTEQEAAAVIQALAELPYKMSAGLIFKLQGQAKQQTETPEKATT